MTDEARMGELEGRLNDFDAETRRAALEELAALAEQGEIALPEPADVANMHCHTFFSYNAYGHSPSSLAWLARRRGYALVGIVDFDVLDGVDEFLAACDLVGVRGSAGMETRVYVPEFADREITSPGEPGITYHMGIGFTSSDAPPEVADILAAMRERATRRNLTILERVNAYLDPVTLDYEADLLPIAPGGTPTERHMAAAYVQAAAETTDDPAAFWARRLDLPAEQVAAMSDDLPKLRGAVRSKLMKRGGVGYVEPTPETFPSVEEVHRLITACGALPCATWLNGLSAGEQAMEELLGLLIEKGVVALNIIPDRNWNVADAAEREIKVRKLHETAALAQEMDLPLNVGTEMNKHGQRLIDDFAAESMAPLHGAFMDGAYFIYGHTALERALGLGYQSAWAAQQLPTRRERNAFYTRVGRAVPPGTATLASVRQLDATLAPEPLLAAIEAAV